MGVIKIMKVAEISTFSQFSVGNIMLDIKNELIKNRHECKVFYFRGEKFGDVQIGTKIGFYRNAIIARILDNDGFCLKNYTKKLIKKLKEFNPDVIHIHCLHGYTINSELLFNYLEYSNKKVIWTMHDNWAVTGHCAYAEFRKCEKWKTGCFNCNAINDYPKAFIDFSKKNYLKKRDIFTKLSKDNLMIISPSKWMDDIIGYSFLNEYKHRVIYNGINNELFINKKSKRENLVLCVASVWDERKNLNDVLKLSKNLREWKIIVIGKIQQKIDYSKYSNIEFLPRTSNREELVNLYNKAKILFNPTLGDNFPTVNLEAQLCGLMVLTYNTGGSTETNLGNLEIVDSLENVSDKMLYTSIYNIKTIMDNPFTKEKMAQEYLKVIEELYCEKS